MLLFFGDYPHAKNLRYFFVHFRYVNDQRILQSDWLRVFLSITEEPDFSETRGFRRIFQKKRDFLKNPASPVFDP